MPSDFQPLAMLVRAVSPQTQNEPQVQTSAPPCACVQGGEAALRAMRLFRAAVQEGVDVAIAQLLEDIAADVVARELQLAPADIAHVVERALSRFLCDDPLQVVVHPDDACEVRCDFPIVEDPSLRRGDARLVLRSGSVDASLGVRLAAVLQNIAS